MKIIPTKVHAIFDYLNGIALIAVPYLISDTRGIEMTIPMVLGVIVLLQSLITNYELSVADILPVQAHLGLDATAGGFLAISPFLFGFEDIVLWPHLLIGLGEIAGAILTEKYRRDRPLDDQTHVQGGRTATLST